MAYAESTIGGSSGGQFRCWVNSIRTYDGGPAENVEDWRVEGGVKRVTSGSRIWNNYNQATYTIQLGMNGVATSGHFNYDTTGAGGIGAWGTGATRVSRNSAGVGFGFQSRTDINMSNSPYLTSGWVTSNDSVQTKYRHASLTALSMDAGGIPATDEGPIWLDFSNPAGASVDAFIEAAPSFARLYTSPGGRTSRYTFPNLAGGSLSVAMQQASPNSNTNTLRIGIHDALGGDSWDYRDRTYTIKNDVGQANPLFSNFTYVDENATTVAITGNNQVLIQDNGNPSVPKSDLKVTVSAANKATAVKYATMSSYLFSVGSYAESEPWSNTLDVVKDIGTVGDVYGDKTISVRAIDSRGNGTTVTKDVTILPYYSPGFYNNLSVSYANDFDVDDGLTVSVLAPDNIIGSIAPMTLLGVDKNALHATEGLEFDIAKDTGSYSGTWTDIAKTLEAGTGIVTVNPTTLATQIETRMNALGADNTVRWYILFKIRDKLETSYYEVAIDVGRPFFRIGADGRLYYKEIEFFRTFSGKASTYQPSNLIFGGGTGATWTRTAISNYAGWARIDNGGAAGTGNSVINNFWTTDMYLPAGQYQFVFYLYISPNAAIIDLWIQDEDGLVVLSFDPLDLYNSTEVLATLSTDILPVEDGKTYKIVSLASSKKATAPASTGYRNAVVAVIANRAGDMP